MMGGLRRKTGLVAAALAVGALLLSCGSGNLGGVQGSGQHVQSQARPVPAFDSIEFSGVGTVTVEQSGTDSVQVTADDNIIPLLTTTVDGTTLRLGARPDAAIGHPTTIEYHVTARQPRSLVLSGAGSINATQVNAPMLSLTNSGAGRLVLAGQTTTENIDLSGLGEIDASALTAQDADVNVGGAGTATVNAARTLNATVTGVGGIEYVGNPTVTQHVTGIGSVRRR
jgi:hypothetical protein